jgi:DNA-binding NarL/FixJ family response regulator
MVSTAHSLSESLPVGRSTPSGNPAPKQTHSRIDRHRSSARPGSIDSSMPIVEQVGGLEVPPIVLYIDKHRGGKDCVSEQLAGHLSGWSLEPLASMSEFEKQADWSDESVVVLHAHSASVATAELASEIAMVAEGAPDVPFVIISDLEDATDALLAIRSGARGYLPASLPLSQVIAAIRFVAAGGTYIPACVLKAASARQRTSPVPLVDGDGNPITFSPRQLQVLERLRQGKQNKIIAYELGMCESTVKVHIRLIMKKLNARNRTQVVLLTNNTHNGPAAEFAA